MACQGKPVGMIDAVDHLVLACPEIEAATVAHATLLGRQPDQRIPSVGDGTATALFRLENMGLELIAPKGEGPVGRRLSEHLAETGPGLASLAYRTSDLDGVHRSLDRRGLAPSDITSREAQTETGETVRWRSVRLDDEAMAGVRSFVVEPVERALPRPAPDRGAVHALDHLVITTPNPQRAVATYGGRLGLRLALDRTAPEWNTHFLFFRLGGLTLEIVTRLDQASDPAGQDRLWGLTWAVADLEAAHARLSASGLEVSDPRPGRKPGSRVFTVRDGTLNVPTLFISHAQA